MTIVPIYDELCIWKYIVWKYVLFYFTLLYFILFYFILFYFILFYFILEKQKKTALRMMSVLGNGWNSFN